MRRVWISLFSLIVLGGNSALAQQSCSVAGAAYASGAATCQPAVRDGQVERVLFTCEDGAWISTDVVCPDKFAYFCRVGPHAVPVGEQLLLGAGPAFLECSFPGIFRLNQDAAPVTVVVTPSALVRSVQVFLSGEGEGLDCGLGECAGQADAKTLSAVASFLQKNFANLLPEEQEAFGVANEAEIATVVLARNPIDVIPQFARIFDVPPAP
ncbi:MAG: hypothetical protein GY798_00130 [Hyphomicrobiales bacterium]|nr:hypothetical protein [Hyphomicrobiales bacterium]